MKIASLKPSQKKRYDLVLTDQKVTKRFTLHQDTVIAFNLLNKPQLDAKTLADILSKDQQHLAMETMLNTLEKKPFSIDKMRRLLKQKGYDEHSIDTCLNEAIKHGYIDEDKTIILSIEDFVTYELKGLDALTQKLHQAGYETTRIQKHIKEITTDLELTKCKAYMEKMRHTLKASTISELKHKLIRGAKSRMFKTDIIIKTLETIDWRSSMIDEDQTLKQMIDKARKYYDLTNPQDKQKLIAKLIRKGYRYDKVKEYLN